MLQYIETIKNNTKVFILAAFPNLKNRSLKEELNILLQKGFSRIFINDKQQTQLRIEDLLAADAATLKSIEKQAKDVYVMIASA